MERFWSLVDYIRQHPAIGILGLVVAYGLYRLLNRKPKFMREADHRVDELRKQRGNPYGKLRPPQ